MELKRIVMRATDVETGYDVDLVEHKDVEHDRNVMIVWGGIDKKSVLCAFDADIPNCLALAAKYMQAIERNGYPYRTYAEMLCGKWDEVEMMLEMYQKVV